MKATIVSWHDAAGAGFLPRRFVNRIPATVSWRLADIVDIASGVYLPEYLPPTSVGTAPYLRVDNVRRFVPNLSRNDLVHVTTQNIPGIERVTIQAGDVVIARTATLGRAFVTTSALAGAVMSQHLTRLRLRDQTFSPYVLAAYLNSPDGSGQLNALAAGSTRLELTHEDLARLQVPRVLASVPWTPHDSKRAETLFAASISQFARAVAACDALLPVSPVPKGPRWYRAPIVAPLSQSLLPRYNDPVFAAGEETLAERYECATIRTLCSVARGAGTSSSEYTTTGIPYLRTSSLINHGIDLFPDQYGTEKTYRAHGQGVGENDVLVTMEGKIGEVALLGPGERALVKNHIEILRPLPGAPITTEFLTAWLASAHARAQFLRRTVVQATIPGLGSASRDLLIPVAAPRADATRFRRAHDAVRAFVREATIARTDLRAHLGRLADRMLAL